MNANLVKIATSRSGQEPAQNASVSAGILKESALLVGGKRWMEKEIVTLRLVQVQPPLHCNLASVHQI